MKLWWLISSMQQSVWTQHNVSQGHIRRGSVLITPSSQVGWFLGSGWCLVMIRWKSRGWRCQPRGKWSCCQHSLSIMTRRNLLIHFKKECASRCGFKGSWRNLSGRPHVIQSFGHGRNQAVSWNIDSFSSSVPSLHQTWFASSCWRINRCYQQPIHWA